MKARKRQPLPELHQLKKLRIRWRIFGTLTFAGTTPCQKIRAQMYFKLLRKAAARCGRRFKKFHWIFREEVGPSGEHLHTHFVTIGKTGKSICEELCRELEAVWAQSGGGISKIDPYNPTLKGWEYILKPSVLADRYRHDIADFSGTDGLTLSASILELAKKRL